MVTPSPASWDLGVCNFQRSDNCIYKTGFQVSPYEYVCKACWSSTSDEERDLRCVLYGLCATTRCWGQPKKDCAICRPCNNNNFNNQLPESPYGKTSSLVRSVLHLVHAARRRQALRQPRTHTIVDAMDRVLYDVLASFPTEKLQNTTLFAVTIIKHRADDAADAMKIEQV